MTDRECMIAIFKAVSLVYREVTGKPLSITVETEQGVVGIDESQEALLA